MSKVEMTMYTVKCDECDSHFTDGDSGFCAWSDFDGAKEHATDSGWIENSEQGKENEHFCPECWDVNHKDEVFSIKTGKFLFQN